MGISGFALRWWQWNNQYKNNRGIEQHVRGCTHRTQGLSVINHLEPVIAAVNGMAVGGGFELVLACDLIVAADHAQFFLPEAQIGIAPDSGGVFRLPKRLPRAIAMEMLLTGRRLSAEEALRWGLVNAVVAPDELIATALALAGRVATSAPLAQQAIMELVSAGESLSVQQAFELQRSVSLPAYKRMLQSQDAEEGSNAFAEGRPPIWKGC
jgi:crotonobetainyl-CoA hydratase